MHDEVTGQAKREHEFGSSVLYFSARLNPLQHQVAHSSVIACIVLATFSSWQNRTNSFEAEDAM